MDNKLSEKCFFSLWVTDFDYISVRHLLAGSLFQSAAHLAIVTIDRYIKTYFWSINRGDLVDEIKNWGGNKSHNILKMIALYNSECQELLKLDEKEQEKLENMYLLYCFRYVDDMYKIKKMGGIVKNYMYTIDKICYFFRSKIKLIPPHFGNTPIDILLEGNPAKLSALNTGNINIKEVFLFDNRYYKS